MTRTVPSITAGEGGIPISASSKDTSVRSASASAGPRASIVPGDASSGVGRELDPRSKLPELERVEREVRLDERRALRKVEGEVARDAAPPGAEVELGSPEGEASRLGGDLSVQAPGRWREPGLVPAEVLEIEDGSLELEAPPEPLRISPVERGEEGHLGAFEPEPLEIEVESGALPPDPTRQLRDDEGLLEDLAHDGERLHLEGLPPQLRSEKLRRPDPGVDPAEAEKPVLPIPASLEALVEATPPLGSLLDGATEEELAAVHPRAAKGEGKTARAPLGAGPAPEAEDPVDVRPGGPVERLDDDARAPDVGGHEDDVPPDQLGEGVADPDRVRGDEGPPLRIRQPHPVEGEPPQESARGEGFNAELTIEFFLRPGEPPSGGRTRVRAASARGGGRARPARGGGRGGALRAPRGYGPSPSPLESLADGKMELQPAPPRDPAPGPEANARP